VGRHLSDAHTDLDYLDLEDKKQLLRRVAYRMQSGADGVAGNLVHGGTLHAVIEEELTERYRLDPVQAKRAAVAIIDQLRQRNFILSRYGPELYGFVHRSFLEFFCAADIERRFHRDRELTPADLRGLFEARWSDPSWREVLRMLAAQLAEPVVGDLIMHLVRVVNPGWLARIPYDREIWWRWPDEAKPWNIVLAAQCVAELRQPEGVGDAGAEVLDAVVLLLESGVDDLLTAELIRDEILPAIRLVGPRWPRREQYLDWYLRRGAALDQHRWDGLAGWIAAELYPDSAAVWRSLCAPSGEEFERPFDRVGIGLAVLLASGHVDPKPFLAELVATVGSGRRSGLALALHERGAVEELCLLAEIDPDDSVARIAIGAVLADLDPDHERARAMLCERAGRDADCAALALELDLLPAGSPNRQAAIAQLVARLDGEYSAFIRTGMLTELAPVATDPAVWSALWQLVLGESDDEVLLTAVEIALDAGMSETHIESALRHRMSAGPAPGPAARVLLLGYPDDREALDQVRRHAATAPDAADRAASLLAIAEARADDPETVRLAREQGWRDPAPAVIVAADRALSHCGAPELARDLLCRRSTDPDPEIARSAAHRLLVGTPREPVTGDRATDPVARAAVRAWVRRSAEPILLSVLIKHPDPDDAAEVRELLFVVSGSWASWTDLAEEALRVAPDAAQAELVRLLGEPEPGPAGWSSSRNVRRLLRNHCAAEPDRAARMWELVRDARPEVRAAAVLVLLPVQPTDSALLDMARDVALGAGEGMLRAEALLAIARARPDDLGLAKFLLDRAVGDEDPVARAAAVRAATLLPGLRPSIFPDLSAHPVR